MATLVSHASVGTHSMPRSDRRSARSDSEATAEWSRFMPLKPSGTGSRAGALVGEEVDVGLDPLGAGLAERQDPQRDPGVLGRDRDVDGRPVADLLTALGGRIGIERGGEEDLASRGIELEDFGGVRRESEAVIAGPHADLVGAAAQDGDVEGIDGDFHQDLGGVAATRGAEEEALGRRERIGLEAQSLERPVAALLDARRYPGEWRQAAERAATARELERGDVVLLAIVIARERRRPQEVDGPVRTDEPAAG